MKALQHHLRLFFMAVSVGALSVAMTGCIFGTKKADADKNWDVQTQTPSGVQTSTSGGAASSSGAPEVVQIESRAPVILYAKAGMRSGEVVISLLNQTDREINVLPQYFALIHPESGRRAIRPYNKTTDQAFQANTKLAAEDQLSLKIEFGNFSGRLDGWRLVFNPEPEGLPPVFAPIK